MLLNHLNKNIKYRTKFKVLIVPNKRRLHDFKYQ